MGVGELIAVLLIFVFTIEKLMTHISAYPEMEIEKFLIDIFGVLPAEGDVLDFEGGSLFFHAGEGFLLFWIVFYH